MARENYLSWQWCLMLTVTFSWGWLLLTVDELWTFHQFEHPSVLIRETNHTKHLQWSLPISTRILILPSSSLDSLTGCSPHSFWAFSFWLCLEPVGRRNMKTNTSQARNTQLVHTGIAASWSQLWIKDCRESNYLAPCLGLFHLFPLSSTTTYY